MFKWMCAFLLLFCSTVTAADSLWVVVDTVNNPGLIIEVFIEQPTWDTIRPPTGETIEIDGKVHEIRGEPIPVLKGKIKTQPDSLGNKQIIDWQMQFRPNRGMIVAITDTLPLLQGRDGKFEDISCRIWLSKDGKKLKLEPDNMVKQ